MFKGYNRTIELAAGFVLSIRRLHDRFPITQRVVMSNPNHANAYVLPFEDLRMSDVESVGGKNASLGEMISQLNASGVRVPTGFATTALAFRDFLVYNKLTERINDRLDKLNVDDVKELAIAGAEIRSWVEEAPFQERLEQEIRQAFKTLDADGKGSFAVRSSATAEDLPNSLVTA